MWILPKQLHTSDFAPDTEALSLDLNESSQLCAQSLFVRSKPSPVRTWLRKWRRDSWTRHLYGRILRPSHGLSFVIAWTSSLEATRVSPSVQQASEPEQTTQDTSGHTSQAEFGFSDPDCASSRMLKDTLALDSEKLLQTWKALVTKRRGEYSARLKLARLTSAKECSSWPTASTRDHKGGYEGGRIRDGKVSMDTLDVAVQAYTEGGILAPSWPTPNAADSLQGGTTQGNRKSPNLSIAAFGLAALANHNTHGSRQESLWPTHTNTGTGRVSDGKRGRDLESCITNPQAWATPWKNCSNGAGQAPEKQGAPNLQTQANGKLNPRWVETLMGLPVGWTMPSCTQPIANPASVVMTSSAGNAEDTTQTVHALGQIAVTTDNRTDELRLLGNGVVPATAALAFCTLLKKLTQ